MFLQHQKGDYLQTIKYLEQLCDQDDGDDLLRLMLLESYLGVQVHDFKAVNAVFDENAAKISKTYQPIIKITKQLLDISTRSDALKTRTEELILKFANHPKQVSANLILFQELCLSSNNLPD